MVSQRKRLRQSAIQTNVSERRHRRQLSFRLKNRLFLRFGTIVPAI
jgi:hypothetical protein